MNIPHLFVENDTVITCQSQFEDCFNATSGYMIYDILPFFIIST